jgi:hypothetical protein
MAVASVQPRATSKTMPGLSKAPDGSRTAYRVRTRAVLVPARSRAACAAPRCANI